MHNKLIAALISGWMVIASSPAQAAEVGEELKRTGDEIVVCGKLFHTTAPVVLGRGKRLFEGFDRDVDLKILSVHHSPYAVHARYAVVR